MKTILFLIAASLFSINAIAGHDTNLSKAHPNKYCAKMKDGKFTIMHEGNAIMSDVTLTNGTIIKMDGTIIKKDGTKTILKQGECIDNEGKIMEEKHKEKTPK